VRPFRKFEPRTPKIRVNERIIAAEVRVIGAEGENIGVLPRLDAIARAKDLGLDLIEISPNAVPPVCKIADFGRYQYEEAKKEKVSKAKQKTSEVKEIQIKIGTGEGDLALKAKKATEWLKEGHRVKIELFLPGRSKYLNEEFLKGRFDRVLRLVAADYKVADAPRKGMKGWAMMIERA
jgi:translation initiation factor IF-3